MNQRDLVGDPSADPVLLEPSERKPPARVAGGNALPCLSSTPATTRDWSRRWAVAGVMRRHWMNHLTRNGREVRVARCRQARYPSERSREIRYPGNTGA